MKKLLTLALTFCAFIVAMACGSNDPDVDGVTGATEQSGGGSGEGSAKGKMLLVYFSRADENWQVGYVERGNTAVMADYIKDLADVDVFEIVPVTPYPAAYNECISYVNDIEIPQNLRPAYKNDIDNLADYETVFIGGPIWWGRPPMIIRTFIEAHPELADKTFIPFGTHGGSGVSSYASLIREYFPNATVLESLGISGSSIRDASSRKTVEDWLKRLGVDKQSTAIRNVQTKAANNGVSYTLGGMRSNGQRGIQIRNGNKYINVY